MTENEKVGWHHQLNGHEFEQAPGNANGQGSLACSSPWGHTESDMIEQMNNNKYTHTLSIYHLCKFLVKQLKFSFIYTNHFPLQEFPANLENSAVATGLEKVSFHSNPKERKCQRMLNCTPLTH